MTFHSNSPARAFSAKGYHKLASIMGGPSSDITVFRRFRILNTLNILSMQAELVELQYQFKDICTNDNGSSDPNEKEFSKNFHALRASKGSDNDKQLQMSLELRSKLKEYNEALLQAAELSKLQSTGKKDRRFLDEWLIGPKGKKEGGGFLTGFEASTWDETADLITINDTQTQPDPFTKWVTTSFLTWFYKHRGRHRIKKRSNIIDVEAGAIEYDEATLDTISTIVSTIFSSFLPVLAVLILFFVKNTLHRIAVMFGMTTTFALALALLTSARRVEIFAAVAAFAAVEVVFIGNVSQPS